MKLTELHPTAINTNTEEIVHVDTEEAIGKKLVVTPHRAIGINFDCPMCLHHVIGVYFTNPPKGAETRKHVHPESGETLDMGTHEVSGENFENLTISGEIDGGIWMGEVNGKDFTCHGWVGTITAGEVNPA